MILTGRMQLTLYPDTDNKISLCPEPECDIVTAQRKKGTYIFALFFILNRNKNKLQRAPPFVPSGELLLAGGQSWSALGGIGQEGTRQAQPWWC